MLFRSPSAYWNLFLPLDNNDYPWLAIILGYPVMGVWFWCTDQSMVQSVLGARNLRQGQLGANFTGWLKIFDVFLFIIPGITCFVLFPGLANPDEAYMTMVTRLLPAGMTGMVMAVLIAVLVSTIDSALNSLSTVFTMDILLRKKKELNDRSKVIAIGRIVTVLGGLTAILLTLAIDKIEGHKLFDIFQAVLSFLAPPMAVVFLLGVLWKRTTARAANFTLTAGTILSIGTGITYLWILPVELYDFWPHFMMLSFYIFIVLALLAILISVFDRKSGEQKQVDYGTLQPAGKKIIILWTALIIVMISLYIIFNGH